MVKFISVGISLCATGYDDILFNFLIAGDYGVVYDGRGWDTQGADIYLPTYQHDNRTIGIAFIGEFDEKKPNDDAIRAAKRVISCGLLKVSHL